MSLPILNAQSPDLILTKSQNESWFEVLQSKDLKIRVAMVRERMIADTNVFLMQNFPDGATFDDFPKLVEVKNRRVQGYCKPLYLFIFKSQNERLYFGNLCSNNEVESLANLMTINSIKRIDILLGEDASTVPLYGSQASCGVIVIELSQRKVWNQVRNFKYEDYWL